MISEIGASRINQYAPTLRGRADAHIENQTTKPAKETTLSDSASQRIVNDKIIDKLDKVLQKSGADSVRKLDYSDYTPEAVSNRILNYVQDAIERAGARGEKNLNNLIQQANAGVQQGFNEAKNILVSLNALSGIIADNVQKTFELIQTGMSEVVDKLQHPAQGAVIESQTFAAGKQAIQQSLELEITTRDGDTLKLLLSRDEQSGQYVAQINGPDGKASYAEQIYQLNNDFSLSVSGNLDEEELGAIKDLLLGVKGVAEEFFNGDAEAALEAGMNLGYDTGEIAAFSLKLDENRSSSLTQAYQEVSQYNQKPGLGQQAMENILKPVQGLRNSLGNTLDQANRTGLFDSPKSRILDMLEYFGRTNEESASRLQQLEAKAGTPFQDIIRSLID